jgi:hypothetical protein
VGGFEVAIKTDLTETEAQNVVKWGTKSLYSVTRQAIFWVTAKLCV